MLLPPGRVRSACHCTPEPRLYGSTSTAVKVLLGVEINPIKYSSSNPLNPGIFVLSQKVMCKVISQVVRCAGGNDLLWDTWQVTGRAGTGAGVLIPRGWGGCVEGPPGLGLSETRPD